MSILETERKEISRIISEALLQLCENKPNDPVDYLSRKMLELIGDEPSKAIRKQEENKQNEETNVQAIITAEKLALKSLHDDFYENYTITDEISINCYTVDDIKFHQEGKAVRILDKNICSFVMSDKKIKMLIELDHPNICKVFQILEDEKYLYVILDYCPGKDLLSYLYDNRDKITEAFLRRAISQMLSGLSYLHKKNIVHKHLTPSKLLVYNREFDKNDIHLKIRCSIKETEQTTKNSILYHESSNRITDPLYMAPEFIEGKYNNKVDIWSAGIIVYLLFCGEAPFKGSKSEILYQIANNKLEIPENLNHYKRELLEKMLCFDPNDRCEADTLLKCEYFNVEPNELISVSGGLAPGSVSKTNGQGDDGDNDFVEKMTGVANFTIGLNLRRSVLSYIMAKKLYDENDKKLRKVFSKLDTSNDGVVEIKEIYKNYRKYFPGTTTQKWKRIKALIEATDINKNGDIEYSEFLTAMSLASKGIGEETLRNVFSYYDENKNGKIEACDIRELFEDTGISDKEIHQMLADCDLNGDRELDFDEFYKLITASF